MKNTIILVLIVTALVTACWSCGPALIKKYGIKDKEVTYAKWQEIKFAALLSKLAYDDVDTIQKTLNAPVWTVLLPKEQSRVILYTDHRTRTHWLAIRGTANKHNALMDAQYKKEKDKLLGIHLHKGFHGLALAAYKEFTPLLHPAYKIKVTGHSLGGAAAAILGMYYFKEKRQLESVITFGQPKVTNEKGCKKYWNMPLTRIVDNKDIVPLVPPLTIISSIGGQYRHVGEEVILHPNKHWVWLSKHNANRVLISGTWSNLFHESVEDHYMKNYLAKIDAILTLFK